jgi:haloacetate dehalogenase
LDSIIVFSIPVHRVTTYLSTCRNLDRVHGICEEYRAAATIARTRNPRNESNARCSICGPKVVRSIYYGRDGALGIWRQWALRANGQAMKSGHFFPERNPDDTAVLVKRFLSA